MMKIHTTQNLNSLGRMQSTNSSTITNDEIRLNYSEQMRKQKLLPAQSDSYESGVSFKGKNIPVKDAKKVIVEAKKMVGDIVKEGKPESVKGDKFLDSPFFHKVTSVADYENIAQAGMAAVVCTIFRPGAIMLLPSKKNKEDNVYASAQSVSSGLTGLALTVAGTIPFKKGADYTMKVMLKDLKESTIRRLYPQLKEGNIKNADGTIKEVKEWVDYAGNKFSNEYKDVAKLPDFKQLADVSEQTFKNVLKVDVDWASQKGKSFNDVVLKDGSKFYDKIDMSRLGFVVKDGKEKAQILFKDLDKDYFEKVIKDAKEANSKWGNLDINTVFNKNFVVQDFRNWKDVNGKQWKLDLDETYVASAFETANFQPRISGKRQTDPIEKIEKFVKYQKNGVEDKLGTEINTDMLAAANKNEGHIKFLTWLPDLALRVPIAVSTIALIPLVLKHVFHLEKSSVKKAKAEMDKTKDLTAPAPAKPQANAPAFKGHKPPEKAGWFARNFGEWYGKRLIESDRASKISEKLGKIKGGSTQFLTTLGSFITSSVYVHQTLTKKDLDPERRKTLAINQGLCFVVPTIAAYSVDKVLDDWKKSKEYRFSGLQERKIEMARFKGDIKKATEMEANLGNKLKGVRVLASLTVFTFIYRFATPVLITPVANWISNKINENKKAGTNNKPAA